jgi:hypothetical protein
MKNAEILRKIAEENVAVQLELSFYDTIRNHETKKRREDLEQHLMLAFSCV